MQFVSHIFHNLKVYIKTNFLKNLEMSIRYCVTDWTHIIAEE